MKIVGKRIAIGMITGAVILCGAIGTYNSAAHAAIHRGPHNAEKIPPRHMDSSKIAEHISERFGVDKAQVQKYLESEKCDPRDLMEGAMISKLSGKSFDDVISAKTDKTRWSEVAEKFGVSKEKIREAHDDMMADGLARNGSISKSNALKLLKDGYRPDDLSAASQIAKASGKSISDVLSKKKLNNSWRDVAKSLGVDENLIHARSGGHRGMGHGPVIHHTDEH